MRIVPQRLRAIRTERGLSRRELAIRSAVSEKQIQRLEFPEQASRTVRPDTLDGLANALGVQPEQLTGEPPTQPDAKTIRVGAALLPGARLAYELIERRYGITVSQLLNAAPLLFALLAEGGLEWRRAQVAELRAIASRLRQSGGPRRDRYGAYARELEEAGDQEEAAISGGNLFVDPLDMDYDNPDFSRRLDLQPVRRLPGQSGSEPARAGAGRSRTRLSWQGQRHSRHSGLPRLQRGSVPRRSPRQRCHVRAALGRLASLRRPRRADDRGRGGRTTEVARRQTVAEVEAVAGCPPSSFDRNRFPHR